MTLADVARFVYLCAMQSGAGAELVRTVAERLTYRAEVSDVMIEGLEPEAPAGVLPDDRPPGLDPDGDEGARPAEERAEIDAASRPSRRRTRRPHDRDRWVADRRGILLAAFRRRVRPILPILGEIWVPGSRSSS